MIDYRYLSLSLVSLALAGCASAPAPVTATSAQPATAPTSAPSSAAVQGPVSTEPKISNVSAAQQPEPGKVATTVLRESPTNVARVMRLASGAVIPEHYHPGYDETFVIQKGSVAATLNGVEHVLNTGDVVVIPAGTVIVGRNAGADEAIVVVVFSGNGRGGPLTVPGHPMPSP